MANSGRWDENRGDRTWPLVEGARDDRRVWFGRMSTAWFRGVEGTQSGRVSYVWNVETSPGSRNGMGWIVLCWYADRERGGSPRRDRMLKKRTPVAERRRETRDSCDRCSAGCRDITGRISARVAGPARVLT